MSGESLTSKLQLALLQCAKRNQGSNQPRPIQRSQSSTSPPYVSESSDASAAGREYAQTPTSATSSGAFGQQAILDYFAEVLVYRALEEDHDYTLSDMLAYHMMHNELSGLIGLREDWRPATQSPAGCSMAAPAEELEDLLCEDAHAGSGDAMPPPSLTVIMEMLVECGNGILAGDRRLASDLVRKVRTFSTPFGCQRQRLAHYFVEALAAKLSGRGAQLFANTKEGLSTLDSQKAFQYVSTNCPYFALAYHVQDRLFLETFAGAERVHIIDYGIANGYQWSNLLHALAARPGGPPHLRITGIEFPQQGLRTDGRIKETGRRLARLAAVLQVPFEYKPIANFWQDVPYSSLGVRQDEVLVVSSIYRMHHLLDESAVPSNPRGKVLRMICNLNPKLFVFGVISWASLDPFIPRLKGAIYHYYNYLDVAETLMPRHNMHRLNLETHFFGRDILSAIACEGKDRMERPEHYSQWHKRLLMAGLEVIPLTEDMMSGARLVLSEGGYHKQWEIGQDQGWLLMGWKDQIINCVSAWRPRVAQQKVSTPGAVKFRNLQPCKHWVSHATTASDMSHPVGAVTRP